MLYGNNMFRKPPVECPCCGCDDGSCDCRDQAINDEDDYKADLKMMRERGER